MMGGESQRSNLTYDTGYSETTQFTGTPSYLEPISGSLHVPIEGVYRVTEKIEDRSAIGEKHNQNNVKNTARTYLERIRNRMQKLVEGLLAECHGALNKGAIVCSELNSSTKSPSKQHESTKKLHAALDGNSPQS